MPTKRARAIIGFLCGAAATVPMTGEFLTARRAGYIDEVPPHKAIGSVAPALREPHLTLVSGAAHLLVGGAAGAIYATLLPPARRGIGTGILFGLGVWLVGYEVVMPLATEMPRAHRDRRDRAATILVAHAIFGAALGALARETDRHTGASSRARH